MGDVKLRRGPDDELLTASSQPVEHAPHIRIRNFSAMYNNGAVQALKDIHLDIPKRQVTAFIGPSGCGKTTMLKWINRLNEEVPHAACTGKILVADDNILSKKTDVVQLRRRIGMIFQNPNPFPKSVRENVLMGPKLHFQGSRSRWLRWLPGVSSLTRQEQDEVVEWALTKASAWEQLQNRLNDSAMALSGGQQQRLCIARAIAIGPEVLLMDEPCSKLDPASTARIEDLIFELRKDWTVVIVTHNMDQARRVADKVAFFYNGELVEAGDKATIFTNPAQQRTEDYITGKFS